MYEDAALRIMPDSRTPFDTQGTSKKESDSLLLFVDTACPDGVYGNE